MKKEERYEEGRRDERREKDEKIKREMERGQ